MFRGKLSRGGKLSPGGVLLLRFVGAILLLFGASQIVPALPALLTGQRATAVVTDVRELPRTAEQSRGRLYSLTVNGRPVTVWMPGFRDPRISLRSGQAVEVAFLPSEPDSVYPLHFTAPWVRGTAFAAFGGFLIWLGRKENHAAA